MARAELREQHVADLAAQKFTLADHPPFALPTATAAKVHAATLAAPGAPSPPSAASARRRAWWCRARPAAARPRRWASRCRTSSPPTRRSVSSPWAGKACQHRVVIMVPAHRLGRQILKRYEALGLSVATLKGRGDPWRPEKLDQPQPVPQPRRRRSHGAGTSGRAVSGVRQGERQAVPVLRGLRLPRAVRARPRRRRADRRARIHVRAVAEAWAARRRLCHHRGGLRPDRRRHRRASRRCAARARDQQRARARSRGRDGRGEDR